MKILRHLLAILALPFVVITIVPRWLAVSYGVSMTWPVSSMAWISVALGVALFVAGGTLAASSVLKFFLEGEGTLAPWDPTKRFVATGPYRYVRNPMITGVCFILASQALILRSGVHAAWATLFALLNTVHIPLVEEPGLRKRFGQSYDEYCRHVRRFVPRLTPYAAGLKPGPTYGDRVVAVVPASGKSSRFGSDKRQAMIAGVPMLQRVVSVLNHAGASRVIVVDNNPDPDRGMFSSIQMGLAEAVTTGAAVVLVQPADMPFVRAATVRAVIDECTRTGRAVCPRHHGKRGHPLAVPLDLARQLLDVNPSTPLNEAFAAIGLVRHELDVEDAGVLRDVDVPADLTN